MSSHGSHACYRESFNSSKPLPTNPTSYCSDGHKNLTCILSSSDGSNNRTQGKNKTRTAIVFKNVSINLLFAALSIHLVYCIKKMFIFVNHQGDQLYLGKVTLKFAKYETPMYFIIQTTITVLLSFQDCPFRSQINQKTLSESESIANKGTTVLLSESLTNKERSSFKRSSTKQSETLTNNWIDLQPNKT